MTFHDTPVTLTISFHFWLVKHDFWAVNSTWKTRCLILEEAFMAKSFWQDSNKESLIKQHVKIQSTMWPVTWSQRRTNLTGYIQNLAGHALTVDSRDTQKMHCALLSFVDCCSLDNLCYFCFLQTAFKEIVCNLSRSQVNELPFELRNQLTFPTFPNDLLTLVRFLTCLRFLR